MNLKHCLLHFSMVFNMNFIISLFTTTCVYTNDLRICNCEHCTYRPPRKHFYKGMNNIKNNKENIKNVKLTYTDKKKNLLVSINFLIDGHTRVPS